MSYICQMCNKTTTSGEKLNKIVLDKRKKTYYNILFKKKRNNQILIKRNFMNAELIEQLKRDGWDKIKERSSIGWEISRELNVCKECYKRNAINHKGGTQ